MYHAASELYNVLIEIYFDKYYGFSDATKKKKDTQYNPFNLMLDGYDYTNWLEKEEPSATKLKIEKEEEPVDIVAIPLLGDNKKGKRRNINGNLNSKQTITRLPLLAALIKSGNIS